jgi:Hemerythrin HHE cation binding domain
MANQMAEVESKAVGTAHAVKAGFKGLRGVFLHLAQEHGEVGALMKHVAKSDDASVRRAEYPKIRAELLSHERGEMAEVYSALSKRDETRSIVSAHNQEAKQLEAAIAAVDALGFGESGWGSAFDRLFALVQQHVAEEENDFFPRAQEVISEDQSKALLERYENAKKAAKSEVQ